MIYILLLVFLVLGWMALNPQGRLSQAFLRGVTRSQIDHETRPWHELFARWLLRIAALAAIALLLTNMSTVSGWIADWFR